MAKRKQHAHRIVREDGSAECECGAEFDSDEEWNGHYEAMHNEDERARLEGRDPAAEAEAQRRFDEAHAAIVAARDADTRGADGD